MRTRVRVVGAWALLTIAGLFWNFVASATAAESEPQEPRGLNQQIERSADERGVLSGDERIGRREGPPRRGAPRPEELRRQLERAMEELNDLRAAGKEDEALQKKRQVMELQERLERLQRSIDRPLRERLERDDVRPRPPADRPEIERRLQHLQVAIENLHAASMHEPAERLTREAEMLRRSLEAGPPGFPPPGAPVPEVQRLRAEVRELRQAIRELRARIDELARERRGR